VRFLVDAQLPARLARHLGASGHEALHTYELPDGNRTTDNAIADADDRVVVTKDSAFRDSHLLRDTPRRLLVVATGNITNDALLALVDEHLDAIVGALAEVGFVELRPTHLIVHEDQDERSNGPPD